MRRTVLVLATVILTAACQPTVEEPRSEAEAAPAAMATAPEMPLDAPPQEEVDPAEGDASVQPVSCRDEIGVASAGRLVERCIAVSPATHPPCNAANPCAMIQGEIDRACGLYGPGEAKPAECSA